MKKYSEFLKEKEEKAIICPSVLSANFAALGEDIKKIEEGADWIHVDVMDGVYVPNISFGIPVVKALKKVTKLPLDVHLMIVDPGRYVDDFIDAGADMLVVHAEACTHLNRVVQTIKNRGAMAGVALNPGTSLCVLEEILPYIDMVLLMTVNPGFGGQTFIESSYEKISRLRTILDSKAYDVHLQVDGGIGPDNMKKVFDAGANAFVAGSAIFGKKNPADAIKELRECLL